MLFPSHEDVLILCDIRDCDWASASVFLKGPEGTELGPMTKINFCIGAPVFVFCKEGKLSSDNFALKIGCQCGMVLSQSWQLCPVRIFLFAAAGEHNECEWLIYLEFGGSHIGKTLPC